MTTTTDRPPAGAAVAAEPPPTGRWSTARLVRIAVVVAIVVLAIVALPPTFSYLKNQNANRGLVVLVAIGVGVFGIFFLFWAMDSVVSLLPDRIAEGIRPWVFVGPALVILTVFLVYPVINTLLLSLKDPLGRSYIGLDNYKFVFTDSTMLTALRNTLGWVILVPLAGVTIGLLFATLADRLSRGEAVAKSMIFLPMAISFAGAAVVWRLIYSFRPEGFGSNIGLLNAIMIGLGKQPVDWVGSGAPQPWNNGLLMIIMVWMQTGFAMVVLSAAIKSIPDEIIEAARIDGASELQVFRRIIIPSILPTIAVVTTYMVIVALKVFDIPFVFGNTEVSGTSVVAERMIFWFFIGRNLGRGAAIAVVLFVAVIPIMLWNIRQFREQEATR